MRPLSKPPNLKSYLNLSSVIIPYNAFGSLGILFLQDIFKEVYLVKSNVTSLMVQVEDLNSTFNIVDSYRDLIDSRKLNESGIDEGVLERPVERISLC